MKGDATADCLLDDEGMTRYLRDGFVVLEAADLDAGFHRAMFAAAAQTHDEAHAIGGDSNHLQVVGDNLRARIPLVDELLASRTVRGALASVLGEDYLLHPHHFVHESTTYDQSFHQDGNLPWNDRAHYRTHRPNWAMLFYYPQPVTLESGPTEVLPGTQYWTTDFEKSDGTWHRGDAVDKRLRPEELRTDDLAARDRRTRQVVDSLGIDGLERKKIELPAGGIVLAHYDLMHRGSRAHGAFAGRRFMYKFYFLRTRDPDVSSVPSWRNRSPEPLLEEPPRPIDGIVESIWQWLRGDADWRANVAADRQLERIVEAYAEDERVRLAYELGWLARENADVLDGLGRLLESENEAVRRAMAYAVGVAGGVAEGVVRAALASADARVRRVAAYAAGEARLSSSAVVERLFERLESDDDDLVRSNAAYALGNIARRPNATVSAERLLARLDPAVEPDNTTNGGMARSTVRVNVLYALANMTLGAADLSALATRGLADHDRYVHGLAVALLQRHAEARGETWQRVLVGELARARFSPRPPRPSADKRPWGPQFTGAAARR